MEYLENYDLNNVFEFLIIFLVNIYKVFSELRID